MNKSEPWVDDADKKNFPALSAKEINSAFGYREMIDADYGKRMNSKYLISHRWDVLLLPHDNSDCGDAIFTPLFEKLAAEYQGFLYALPALSERSETALIPLELELYDPPLVAKISCNYDGFISARKGLVNIFSNAFYLFAENREFCMLNVEGRYSMLAAPRKFLNRIFPQSPKDTWLAAASGKYFQDQDIAVLLIAMNSLGYGD